MSQTFLIIWAFLGVSQVVYLLVPVPSQQNASTLSDVFPMALAVVAFIQAIGMVILLRVRAFEPIRSGRIDPRLSSGVVQLFTPLILAWVLAESVAIYGLVLRFLHYSLSYSVWFSTAGAVLLFMGRPWQRKLQKPYSATQSARSGAPIE